MFYSYTWRTTEWSDCSIDSLLSQQDSRRGSRNVTGLCGGGLQTRDVYCVQANAELLNYLSEFREKDKGKILVKSLHLSVMELFSSLMKVQVSTRTQVMLSDCSYPLHAEYIEVHAKLRVWSLSRLSTRFCSTVDCEEPPALLVVPCPPLVDVCRCMRVCA